MKHPDIRDAKSGNVPSRPPSLDIRADDVRAVMDAAGSGRAVLVGESDMKVLCLTFCELKDEDRQANRRASVGRIGTSDEATP